MDVFGGSDLATSVDGDIDDFDEETYMYTHLIRCYYTT